MNERISATVPGEVLDQADLDAARLMCSRSELVERALRREHVRIVLEDYRVRVVAALDVARLAADVYAANLTAGL